MHKIPGPEIRAMATRSMALKDMVMAMFGVMGNLVVRPIPWMPMSSRGI